MDDRHVWDVPEPPEPPGRFDAIQAAFEEWLATGDGQLVHAEAITRARRLVAQGFRHYSIDAIYQSIRFDRSIQVGPDADGYKLNDHHRSRLARRIMADAPDLDGFFELRKLRSPTYAL